MRDKEFEITYESARTSLEEGHLDDAERLYKILLDQSPNGYADVFNALGLIYVEKGLVERATQYFEKALAVNPKYTEASLNLVISYNEMKRFDDAEKVFKKAAQIAKGEGQPMDPFIQGKLANEHAKLGSSYYGLGLYPEALEEYRKALRLRPEFVDILTQMGILLREQGSFDESILYLERAKGVNPEYFPAYINLGLTYYCRGDIDRAIHEWKVVQEKDPTQRGVQAYLALAKKT